MRLFAKFQSCEDIIEAQLLEIFRVYLSIFSFFPFTDRPTHLQEREEDGKRIISLAGPN